MKRILSIDGGGIRGIIPGLVIAALEDRLQELSGDPSTRIADYFDILSGTSTDGILPTILSYTSDEDHRKPKYSAREALNIYLHHGEQIFSTHNWRRFLNKFGLLSELYDADILENILLDYFGDTKLSQLVKPCIITAYNIELRKN